MSKTDRSLFWAENQRDNEGLAGSTPSGDGLDLTGPAEGGPGRSISVVYERGRRVSTSARQVLQTR